MEKENKKIKEFFSFTIWKLILSIAIGIIFAIGSVICFPKYFIEGSTVYSCGYILAVISTLPYRLPVTLPIYLALFYIISCLIIYIWRRIKSVKRK